METLKILTILIAVFQNLINYMIEIGVKETFKKKFTLHLIIFMVLIIGILTLNLIVFWAIKRLKL